jgi:hypothetical protein
VRVAARRWLSSFFHAGTVSVTVWERFSPTFCEDGLNSVLL